MIVRVDNLDGLHQVSEIIESHIENGYLVILLYGDLGAGKTTLVKHLCQEWGVMEPVSSPTFSLVQEYYSPSKGILYHMDLYRLDRPQDLQQIGFEEYIESGNICMIEWPQLAADLYTIPHIKVMIEAREDNLRTFSITTHDAVDT